MLRGKFGQIGSEFRDGHITMDAFEQVYIKKPINKYLVVRTGCLAVQSRLLFKAIQLYIQTSEEAQPQHNFDGRAGLTFDYGPIQQNSAAIHPENKI